MTPAAGVRTAHPRLFALVAVGVVGLAAGTVLGLLPGVDPTGVWALRLGFVGFVLLAAGVAGYVSLGVFERQDR